MLTSVLPGLRELRAPLSAGFLWLLALWFAAERVVPERTDASGTVASAYRLGGLLETIGLGAALTFAAYLVGSLSVFLFTGPLRRTMRTSAQEPRSWRDTLSPGAWQALQEIVHDAAERLNEILALSGIGIDEAIDQFRQSPRQPSPDPPRPTKFAVTRPRPARGWRRVLAKYRRPRAVAPAIGGWELPDERAHRRLAELVIPDLPVIASTRLLGKHPAMFSAVDRDRAEVDFRLAVIPPVLALAIAVGAAELGWVGLLVVVTGAAIVLGLLLDAIHQQRQAYDLLLDLLQVKAITAPSLERLESWAVDQADRTPSKTLARHVRKLSHAIRTFLKDIVDGSSAPVMALADGAERLAQARQEFAAIKALNWQALPPETVQLTERLLGKLDRTNRKWRRFNLDAVGGEDAEDLWPESVDTKQLGAEVGEAKQDFDTLVGFLEDATTDAANRAAAGRAVGGENAPDAP